MRKLLLMLIVISISWSLWADPPAQFDLREYEGENFVTSVKNQQGGTCWTHGTIAAIESNMLMTDAWTNAGETGEPALAEYHLDWWNGFNQHNNDDIIPHSGSGLEVHMGGDYRVSTAYLSRGEGAVRDEDGQSYASAPNRTSSSYHYFYPRDVEWFVAGENLENIDTIKNVIMETGAIGICMAYDNQFMSGYNHYQPASSDMLPNHAITVVGWDDSHVTQAPNAGAWIVKNSWGSGWGNDGYFWISYYDKWATQEPEMGAISFRNVEPMQYSSVYYHDYHGWRDTLEEVDEAFNAFQTENPEVIQAASFFCKGNDISYSVKIFDDFIDGTLQNEIATAFGTQEYEGFHTVNFDQPVSLPAGEDFYIYLSLSSGGQPIDRSSDVPVLLGASYRTMVESSANADESFYLNDAGSWVDLYGYDFENPTFEGTANFCIKALGNVEVPDNQTPSNLQIEVYETNEVELSWDFDATSRNVTGYKIYRNGVEHEEIECAEYLVLSYLDHDLDAGTYEYYVVAIYDGELSEASETVSGTVVLPSPENLNFNGINETTVVIDWNEPDSYYEGFKLYKDGELFLELSTLFYTDFDVPAGDVEYAITAVYDGFESEPLSGTYANTDTETDLVFTDQVLGNYPNPFNPTTEIRFSLAENSSVELKIYNAKGEFVKQLASGKMDAGMHSTIWNGNDKAGKQVPSGIYFYNVKTESINVSKKMILLK